MEARDLADATPFLKAVAVGPLYCLRFLARTCDVHARNGDGKTAFNLAQKTTTRTAVQELGVGYGGDEVNWDEARHRRCRGEHRSAARLARDQHRYRGQGE